MEYKVRVGFMHFHIEGSADCLQVLFHVAAVKQIIYLLHIATGVAEFYREKDMVLLQLHLYLALVHTGLYQALNTLFKQQE